MIRQRCRTLLRFANAFPGKACSRRIAPRCHYSVSWSTADRNGIRCWIRWERGRRATVYFEYRVASPKPGGNPSQTDALVLFSVQGLGCKAKWTEPRYETVARRLSKPEADGADPRVTLNGWLQHLQRFATRHLDIEDFADVVYQVLHRAASACAVATEQQSQPQLIYLHFHPSPLGNSATTDRYLSDVTNLHSLLGNPDGLTFAVVELPLHPTPAFEAIKDLDKRLPSTSARVSEALCRGALFTFNTPTIKRV